MMTVPCQKFQQSREEVLTQDGVVDGDGVGDGRHLMVWCPPHVGELVGFVGKGEGLNLHHAHALHGVSKTSTHVVVSSWLCRERGFGNVCTEVFVSVADRQFFNEVHRVKEIKSPSGHRKQEF